MEPHSPPPLPPRNIAIFDIGSNAVRLSIAKIDGSQVSILKKETELCEMGRTHDKPGYLYPDGVARAIKTIDHYCKIVRGPQSSCTHIVAVATDAIRRAADGPDFIARLKQSFDLVVQVLSPEQEGFLGARGVLYTMPDANGIVADLGGGSLQLTRVANGRPHETISLPLGTLRMVGAAGDLPTYIDTHLATVPATLNTTKTLYIIGGSWRSFAKLYQARSGEQSKDVQGLILAPDMVRAMHQTFKNQPINQVEASLVHDHHLEKSRAEGVPRATHLLSALIDLMSPDNIIVSAAGIRDGIIQGVMDGSITPTPIRTTQVQRPPSP